MIPAQEDPLAIALCAILAVGLLGMLIALGLVAAFEAWVASRERKRDAAMRVRRRERGERT